MRAFPSNRYHRHSDPLGTGMQPPTAYARACEDADAVKEANYILWQSFDVWLPVGAVRSQEVA